MRSTSSISRSTCHDDITNISDIWKELLLDPVGARFGLPPASMLSLGVSDCLFSSYIVNVELKSSPSLVPHGLSKTDVPAVRAHNLPLTRHPSKSSRAPLWLLSLPGLTIFMLGSPNWQFSSTIQDLARSPSGWIKTSALIAYNGPSIPGNFDTHSGEIVNTSTFLLKVHGLSQPLTDEYIKGLVSKDNLRGPKRFILGLYAPGKKTNSTQLVIRLTPIPAADPNAGAASASSLRTSRPLTLDEAEPCGVYFFQSSMLRVLTREGICPKKKSQPGRSSLLKVQPTDNPGPVGSSQLRGRSDACFLIDIHASIKAGAEWIMYTNDGCYGTDHIPITPQFLLVAFRFTPRGSRNLVCSLRCRSRHHYPHSHCFSSTFFLYRLCTAGLPGRCTPSGSPTRSPCYHHSC